ADESALEWPQPVFSPDGKVVARLALDGTVRLHDTADGKEKLSLGGRGKGEAISSVVFAPDGKTLAASLGDGRGRLYDPGTGEARRTCAAGAGRHRAPGGATLVMPDGTVDKPDAPPLTFSPDGKVLGAVSEENAVRLWDAATGKPLPGPAGHRGAVADLAVSADGKVVVTRGSDGTLRRWERATGKELSRVAAPGGAGAAALSPSGWLFAAVGGGTVRVRDAATGKGSGRIRLAAEPGGVELPSRARFSADEKVLATGELTGTVRLWDVASGKALRTLAAGKKDDTPNGGL